MNTQEQFNKILETVTPILLKSYLGELTDQKAESIIKGDIKKLRQLTKDNYLIVFFVSGAIQEVYLMDSEELEENITTLEEKAKKGDIMALDLKYNNITYIEA